MGLDAVGMGYGMASVLRWSDRLANRAVGAYDRLFRLNRTDEAEILLGIGEGFAGDGRCEPAVAALRRTLDIQPDNADAWYALGIVYLRQQAADAAVEAFERARAVGEGSFELYFHLAEARQEVGDHESAVADLRAAIEWQPDAHEAHYWLGVTLDKIGRCDEAVVALEKAIDLAPREVAYHQSLGFTLEGMGARVKALDCFKRSLELERRLSAQGVR